MRSETAKIGKRFTLVIPAGLRQEYGLEENGLVVMEGRPEGILLRPVVTLPVELYTPERKAEFLLNSVATEADYTWAVGEVRKMGLDPETIPHQKPEAHEKGSDLS
ncbi:MAG: AbrB/MazE/SpoVT family DNA-binding domain-containing protein [Proteobacteria bacterium]|nr:AbrB/MazE/SpoVT family DNA-binding domain-containing protein [Pseudomonadota bacterium]MBU2226595.1 AbrB/MazE/SpoVT family DNA-binding domain-containing protein [Pseudomonadota bacterium]MBU2261234.1 AbrB/MazE/SpoVT family DNA-binding domain-containing protein [Pseudomonadota bacterium]